MWFYSKFPLICKIEQDYYLDFANVDTRAFNWVKVPIEKVIPYLFDSEHWEPIIPDGMIYRSLTLQNIIDDTNE